MVFTKTNDNNRRTVIPVFKRMGETPLQALERVRPALFLPEEPVTYAGRLDPLAEGVLLLLSGPSRYEKTRYTSLPKEYIFDCLWGVRTDTHDVLGLSELGDGSSFSHSAVIEAAGMDIQGGTITQKRPVFSSGMIKRDHHAVRGMKEEEVTDSKEVVIHRSLCGQTIAVSSTTLLDSIEDKITRVNGDFRQEEIVSRWRTVLTPSSAPEQFFVTRYVVRASHGMYVRALVRDMGRRSGLGATTLHITRTTVGLFSLYNTCC